MGMMTRRAALALGAAAPLLRPHLARAAWPDQPVRLIVPFAPGGNSDITARACAPAMSAKLGQPVIVENRAGAGGSVAARQVARLLHSSSDRHGLPWHRVINSQGRISLPPGGGGELQRSLLEAEGICFEKDSVDFEKYGWRPVL